MFEKLVSLFERAVIALETIAANGSSRACKTEATSAPNPLETCPMDYEAIASGPGGDAIIRQMCADRGIEVPPRTRTTTLIQKLKVRDEADKALKDAANEALVEEIPPLDIDNSLEASMSASNNDVQDKGGVFPEPEKDESPADTSEIPEDPFKSLDLFQAATVYTPEEVRACLQHWYSDLIAVPTNNPEFRKKAGEATVKLMELLKKYGQSNPKAIPEDVCQILMSGEPDLVKIYETRVKGVAA